MNRQLTELEKRIMLKQISRLKEENKGYDFMIRYDDLMISEGLYRNFLVKLEEMKKERQDIMNQVKENTSTINVLMTQIKDGVEVREMLPETPSGVG